MNLDVWIIYVRHSRREALYLEYKFGVPVEKDYIVQGKETIDRLEDQRQDIRRKQQAGQERDAIVAEVKKYGGEIPSIKRIKELEMQLDEAKKLKEQLIIMPLTARNSYMPK